MPPHGLRRQERSRTKPDTSVTLKPSRAGRAFPKGNVIPAAAGLMRSELPVVVEMSRNDIAEMGHLSERIH